MPSVRNITLRPVRTDDVSRLTAPGFGKEVLGEDVEISRLGDDAWMGWDEWVGLVLPTF